MTAIKLVAAVRSAVRAGRLLSLCFALVFATSAVAEPRTPNICEPGSTASEASLQQAVAKSIAGMDAVELQSEDMPGAHQKFISDAFARTFNLNIHKLACGYAFCLVKSGDNFFSVDRFTFKNRQAADAVDKVIRRRKINNLQVKSLTYYDFFVSGNDLVFFIADRQSYQESQALFKAIKENYLQMRASNADSPVAR